MESSGGKNNELDAWETFVSLVRKSYSDLGSSKTKQVDSEKERAAIRQLIQYFFRRIRSGLEKCGIEVSRIDEYLQNLLVLANRRGSRKIYLKNLKLINKIIPEIEIQRERWMSAHGEGGNDGGVIFSKTEIDLQKTLDKIDPGLGGSYQQTLLDLSDTRRISYGGTANELREIVRRVLDKLAPDEEVRKAKWFVLEKGANKPTMKQKTQFILDSRGLGKSQKEPTEKTVNLIEIDTVGSIARSTYDAGSSLSHTQAAKDHTMRLKRYVDAVLSDLLEIKN